MQFATLATRIRYELYLEALPPGTRLPSIADYATRYGVSRPTVIKAMRVLAEGNVVTIVPGRGLYSVGADGDPGVLTDRLRDRIEQHIRAAVRDSAPGAALPMSTETMMAQFGASQATVRRVEARLEALLVIRRDATGRYVRPYH